MESMVQAASAEDKASLSLPELVSSAEDTIRRVYAQSAQLEVMLSTMHPPT